MAYESLQLPARRLAGLGDVEQEIPGIDKPTGT